MKIDKKLNKLGLKADKLEKQMNERYQEYKKIRDEYHEVLVQIKNIIKLNKFSASENEEK